ncbi:hypothetical protein CYMTET_26088 [Cymbomonas tetramitiformis]|uniref:Uncharacterized protein n=1 Tax=Cymbomonas tetramitiformis TaxID=36881 RepID=A0AAE0FSJ4_9CHLO|nr:hypothetical protein CYMTET_26088 [Cymbomonas tetramitiformis]
MANDGLTVLHEPQAKLQNVNWMGAKIEYADLADSNMDHGEQLDTVDFENVRFSEQTSLDHTDLGRFTVSSKRLALPQDNSLYQAIFKHTAQKLFEGQVEGVDGDDDAEDGSDDGDDDNCDAIDEDVVEELLDVDPKKFGEAMLDRFAENIFKVLGDVLLRFLHDDTFAKTIVFEKMDGNAKPFASWMITQLQKRGHVDLAQDHENVPDGLRPLWEQTFQAPEECDAEDRPPSCPDKKLASALLAELLCAEEQAVQQLEEWIETQLNSPKPSAVRTLLVKLLCSDNEAVRTKVQQLIEQQEKQFLGSARIDHCKR